MKTNTDIHTNSAAEQDSDALALSSKNGGIAPERLEYPDDCEGLDYHVDEAAGVRVGYVEEINGLGGALAPEFVPTRFELEIIATYWMNRRYDNEWKCRGREMGHAESRENAFASRRLRRLRILLGEERYRRVGVKVLDSQMEVIQLANCSLDSGV